MLARGESLECVLQFLRERGFTKGRTMQFLAEQLGMDADAIPDLVHRSNTWADRLAVDSAVSSAMLDVLDSMRPQESDTPIDLTEFLRSDDSDIGRSER